MLHPISRHGERVQLVEIGSHCRGSIFRNAIQRNTAALEQAFDKLSHARHSFFFGRFDLRAPFPQAFAEGRFKVLELNGVTAEATHIYDPAVAIVEAYRVLARQWRIAFGIGAEKPRARSFTNACGPVIAPCV